MKDDEKEILEYINRLLKGFDNSLIKSMDDVLKYKDDSSFGVNITYFSQALMKDKKQFLKGNEIILNDKNDPEGESVLLIDSDYLTDMSNAFSHMAYLYFGLKDEHKEYKEILLNIREKIEDVYLD